MVKVKVTKQDVRNARRVMSSVNGADVYQQNPVSHAIRRLLSEDPRWRCPVLDGGNVVLHPYKKYPNLNSVTLSIPKKVQSYYKRFLTDPTNSSEVIEFVIRGVDIVDGRLVVS